MSREVDLLWAEVKSLRAENQRLAAIVAADHCPKCFGSCGGHDGDCPTCQGAGTYPPDTAECPDCDGYGFIDEADQ